MSAANVAEETKADVEAVKSVEDASYPTIGDCPERMGSRANPLPSLPPTPRHSRKMMRDGLVYDFTRDALSSDSSSSASPTIASFNKYSVQKGQHRELATYLLALIKDTRR